MVEIETVRRPFSRYLASEIVTVVLFVALSFLLLLNHVMLEKKALNTDSFDFLKLADSMIEDRAFSKFKVDGKPMPDTIRTPGYPLFLAACKILFGDPVKSARILQPLVMFASMVVFFREIRRRFGKETANLTLLFLLAIPMYFAFSTIIFSEALAMSCIVVAVSMGMRDRCGRAQAIFCGLLVGYATLCRPNILFLLGPLFLWQWHFRKNRLAAATMAVAFIATISPWVARNYVTFGKLTPGQPADRHPFLSLYTETTYGVDYWVNTFSPEMIRDGFKDRHDQIHAKAGAPPGGRATNYFMNEKHLPSLELMKIVSDEISRWELELIAEHGRFRMYLRRSFLIAPQGWITKTYSIPFRRVLGPMLLAMNIVILTLAILSSTYRFGYRISLALVPGYFVFALAAGYFPATIVLLPSAIFLYVLYRNPKTDPLIAISLAIMSHYLLLPMVIHVEGRYVRPMTPFMCLLAADTALRMRDRICKIPASVQTDA